MCWFFSPASSCPAGVCRSRAGCAVYYKRWRGGWVGHLQHRHQPLRRLWSNQRQRVKPITHWTFTIVYTSMTRICLTLFCRDEYFVVTVWDFTFYDTQGNDITDRFGENPEFLAALSALFGFPFSIETDDDGTSRIVPDVSKQRLNQTLVMSMGFGLFSRWKRNCKFSTRILFSILP